MFKPTYVYIKTHDVTGLKYFGKTTAKDPYKYQGSGVYWKNHIKKHGYDVSTEILGYFVNEEECKNFTIRFSKENNIVNSKEWANLKEECLDGGFDYINEKGINNSKDNYKKACVAASLKYQTDLEYRNERISRFTKIVKELHEQNKIPTVWKANDPRQKIAVELSKTENAKEKQKQKFKENKHQQGEKNSQYGTCWVWKFEEGNKKIKNELLQEYIDKGWERKYIPGYRV